MSSAAQIEKKVATDGWALPVSSCEMNDADTSMSLANCRSEIPRSIRRWRKRAPTNPGARRFGVVNGCGSARCDLRALFDVARGGVVALGSVATLLGTPIIQSLFPQLS